MIRDGKEITSGPDVDPWKGAQENYRLIRSGDATELQVELDMNEKDEGYFLEAFPLALQRVKDLAEQDRATT